MQWSALVTALVRLLVYSPSAGLAMKNTTTDFFVLTFERSGQQSAVVTIFAAECSITAKLEQREQSCNKRSSCRDQLEIFTGGSMLT